MTEARNVPKEAAAYKASVAQSTEAVTSVRIVSSANRSDASGGDRPAIVSTGTDRSGGGSLSRRKLLGIAGGLAGGGLLSAACGATKRPSDVTIKPEDIAAFDAKYPGTCEAPVAEGQSGAYVAQKDQAPDGSAEQEIFRDKVEKMNGDNAEEMRSARDRSGISDGPSSVIYPCKADEAKLVRPVPPPPPAPQQG